MLSMKSPRPVRQHKGGPSSSLQLARGNAGKGTRMRAATLSSSEVDDPTDRILSELYPTHPRSPPPVSYRPRLPMAHKNEERMVRLAYPFSHSKVLIRFKRAINSRPTLTQQADAGPLRTAAYGPKLGEAHMRSSRVEVQLGMHVLRCLELVGELASEAQSRMHIHINDPHDHDFAEVDQAIQEVADGNTHDKPPGAVCHDCDGKGAEGTVQGVEMIQGAMTTVQEGGATIQGGGVISQGGKRVYGISQSSPPALLSRMGSSHTSGPHARRRVYGLTQRFNQAEIRQVGIAFSLDLSALTIPVSRMWLSGNREGHPNTFDLASILGSGPSVASLLVN